MGAILEIKHEEQLQQEWKVFNPWQRSPVPCGAEVEGSATVTIDLEWSAGSKLLMCW